MQYLAKYDHKTKNVWIATVHTVKEAAEVIRDEHKSEFIISACFGGVRILERRERASDTSKFFPLKDRVVIIGDNTYGVSSTITKATTLVKNLEI
jgi:hypothetical protein